MLREEGRGEKEEGNTEENEENAKVEEGGRDNSGCGMGEGGRYSSVDVRMDRSGGRITP